MSLAWELVLFTWEELLIKEVLDLTACREVLIAWGELLPACEELVLAAGGRLLTSWDELTLAAQGEVLG